MKDPHRSVSLKRLPFTERIKGGPQLPRRGVPVPALLVGQHRRHGQVAPIAPPRPGHARLHGPSGGPVRPLARVAVPGARERVGGGGLRQSGHASHGPLGRPQAPLQLRAPRGLRRGRQVRVR